MNESTQTVLETVLEELDAKRQALAEELTSASYAVAQARTEWQAAIRYRDEVAAALRAMTPRKRKGSTA